ncbi:MAG: UxaA family hydrolase, partial [Bryobacterales bacterium]|nr:UxaA family hydrolase [Bryobacterales bacterium]
MAVFDIVKIPTAENVAIHLHPSDNIAVARAPLSAGQTIFVEGAAVKVADAVPAGHKIALKAIRPEEMVVRYGQAMGRARVLIEAGRHVHTHNVSFEELPLTYEFPEG